MYKYYDKWITFKKAMEGFLKMGNKIINPIFKVETSKNNWKTIGFFKYLKELESDEEFTNYVDLIFKEAKINKMYNYQKMGTLKNEVFEKVYTYILNLYRGNLI